MNNEVAIKEQFKWLAKLGYAARGTIYLVIGILAVMAAFTGNGKTTDSKGAIATILEQPFGNVLIVALIVGLLGYVAWRLTQSIKDTDDHGTDLKGILIRVGLFVSAISHLLLAYWATTLLFGEASSGSSGNQSQGLLSDSSWQIVIAVIGVAAIGAGIAHIFKGWTAKFDKYMDIPEDKHQFTRPICRFGLISRGFVWCLIGWFLIRSALLANSNEITGLQEALQSLVSSGFGPWLLGVVAVGLVAFGIYSFLEAIYRRVDIQKSF